MAKKRGGMGFRDLQLFNKALLARQGWRLMQHPHSFVCRVLKAKYFLHHSFLEASVKGNASFIWRSICESKDVLWVEMRWWVGMGDKINFWKDPWLMGSSSARVLSPVYLLNENATVDSLILQDSMSWNMTLIDNIFMPSEAMAIKETPLSHRRP